MRTAVKGCGVVVWFGKYTDTASLVLLFGFTHVCMYVCMYVSGAIGSHEPRERIQT